MFDPKLQRCNKCGVDLLNDTQFVTPSIVSMGQINSLIYEHWANHWGCEGDKTSSQVSSTFISSLRSHVRAN